MKTKLRIRPYNINYIGKLFPIIILALLLFGCSNPTRKAAELYKQGKYVEAFKYYKIAAKDKGSRGIASFRGDV